MCFHEEMSEFLIECAQIHSLSGHFSIVKGITQVSSTHHCTTRFHIERKRSSVLFFLTDNLHKDAPVSHIGDLRDNAAVTFRSCTPRSLSMPLTEDDEQLISRRPGRVHTSRVSGFEIGVGQQNMQNQKIKKPFCRTSRTAQCNSAQNHVGHKNGTKKQARKCTRQSLLALFSVFHHQ